MKEILTGLLLIILLAAFSCFIIINEKSNSVLTIYTPTKIGIDINKNRTIDSNEIYCVNGAEAFSLEPKLNFIDQYSQKYNLNNKDLLSLGYLAQEFAENTLLNKSVSIKNTNKITPECRYTTIKINGINYATILKNSGYGIINKNIGNNSKFKENLTKARNLNLVILNHKSNKYHTLDCPYGNIAHDTVIIPKKHLTKDAKPCKFCNEEILKSTKNKSKTKNLLKIDNIPQPPLTISDDYIKIIFTDFTKNLKPNNNCTTYVCKELVHLINTTKESIDIAAYGYKEVPAITKALSLAKNRGVIIRYVYDSKFNITENYYPNNLDIINLSNIAISDKNNSKTQSNMLMHNKFIIFDKKKVFTGSMNLSPTGLSDYDVNSIAIISSPEIAKLYSKEFEQMLAGKFHNSKSKLNMQNKFTLGTSEVEIYFSPQDTASKRIIELIDNAKETIYIPTFLITHKDIATALIKAKQRQVNVKIIIDANSTNTRNTKHALLRQNNIQLKTENYAGKLHAKTIIIDNEYLILGSMNFSNSGDNKNDENLVIIKNPKFAKAHHNFFLYLWAKIPNKYLEKNAKAESSESIGACSDGIDNNFNGKTDKEEELCR